MKQYEAVIRAMQEHGGYATLAQLYQSTMKIPNCRWGTKTPFASIRRIVQTYPQYFYKVRPGLWALVAEKKKFDQLFVEETGKEAEYTHYYFQGLLVEIGNLKGFKTFIPNQDKNKPFLQMKLDDVSTLKIIAEFTYPRLCERAKTVDVVWFNPRGFPDSLFEVEHSTGFDRALLKFIEFQDFRVKFFIVADKNRKAEFQSRFLNYAFEPIKSYVKFLDYDYVSNLHGKISESAIAERLML